MKQHRFFRNLLVPVLLCALTAGNDAIAQVRGSGGSSSSGGLGTVPGGGVEGEAGRGPLSGSVGSARVRTDLLGIGAPPSTGAGARPIGYTLPSVATIERMLSGVKSRPNIDALNDSSGRLLLNELISEPTHLKALQAVTTLGLLPPNMEAFSYHRFEPGRLAELVRLKREVATSFLLPYRDMNAIEDKSARATLVIYDEAFARGVLDPALKRLLPKVDGSNPVNLEAMKRLNSIIPKALVVAFLGNPSKGGPCQACTPSPGSPAPGSGFSTKSPTAAGAGALSHPTGLDSSDAIARARTQLLLQPRQPGRRPEYFDPLGFLDVVLIRLDSGLTCTGVAISKVQVLTAAHCLPPRAPNGGPGRIRVLFAELDQPTIVRCIETLQKDHSYRIPCTPFKDAEVVDYASHSAYEAGSPTRAARNDIGIVRVRPRLDELPRRIARLDFGSSGDVTFAGFGNTNLAMRTLEAIEVGWNRIDKWKATEDAFFYDSKNLALTGACGGDSGAPIFKGVETGLDKEVHAVMGLISAGRNDNQCDGSYWISATRFGQPEIRDWLCGMSDIRASNPLCQSVAQAATSAVVADGAKALIPESPTEATHVAFGAP